MKIAVMGAGAIGSVLGGCLAEAGEDVLLIGRKGNIDAINKNGLQIDGVRGRKNIRIKADTGLTERPDMLFLCVKTQDIPEACKAITSKTKDSIIITMQNGVKGDVLAAESLNRRDIVSSVVMFGATYIEHGKFIHNFEGDFIIGNAFSKNDDAVNKAASVLNKFSRTHISDNIHGVHWTKLLLNLNNCIPAITGRTMQESFADMEQARFGFNLIKEGLTVIDKAGIRLSDLPDLPLTKLRGLLAVPIDEGAVIFSHIMQGLSKEPLYGSILQSIKRGKATEIDYLNGEIVELGKRINLPTPYNSKAVEMVHKVERKM
ncbi:MAG: ketopantoate reductase family protein, partial [Nitrospirota bacterium]